MTDNTIRFPPWFTVLTGMLIITNFVVFGWATLLFPSFAFPDMGHTAAAFPIQFFAVRHIALSVPLLHGLLRKNVSVLRAMYTVFVIMAVLDVSLLILNGYYIPVLGNPPFLAKVVIGVSMFIAPMSLSLFHLRSYEVPS